MEVFIFFCKINVWKYKTLAVVVCSPAFAMLNEFTEEEARDFIAFIKKEHYGKSHCSAFLHWECSLKSNGLVTMAKPRDCWRKCMLMF